MYKVKKEFVDREVIEEVPLFVPLPLLTPSPKLLIHCSAAML